MSFECEYCKKNFSSISSLNYHKKTAKKCLNNREISTEDIQQYNCELCNKTFSQKHNFQLHNKKCKVKLNLQEKQTIDELLTLKDEVETFVIEKNKQTELINKLQEENRYINIKYKELLKKYEDLKLELSEYKGKLQSKDEEIKRLEILAKKPTTTTNHYNNCNNKYEMKIAFERLVPFTEETINNSLRQYINSKSLKEGEESFSSDLNKSLEDKLIVTDMSRGKAIVKSETGSKKNTTTKKVIKDVFKYGKNVILENCDIALDELEENSHHNFNKEYCQQTNYIRKIKNTVNKSIQNKNTDITTSLSNKLDLILE